MDLAGEYFNYLQDFDFSVPGPGAGGRAAASGGGAAQLKNADH